MIRAKEGKENYVVGGEESFGLMIGNQIRDKDSVSAVALICEMVAYERNKGRSIFDKLIELYVEYGFYKESLVNIVKKGMDGAKEIAQMMEDYRKNPPKSFNGANVEQLLDYELQQGKNLLTGETWKIDLPKSNVLQFVLADGTRVSARPSGTEPKIKFYFSVNTALNNAADFKQTEKILDDKLDALAKEMGV